MKLSGPATGAQLMFLSRLYNEAFKAGYTGKGMRWTGLDVRQAVRSIENLRHSGKQEASDAIQAMLDAKNRGWRD